MNRLKVVLLVAAGLVAVLLIAVVLAFTSGVQTWAARRALAGQPGLKADIGRLSAGLSFAELRDVRMEKDGMVLVAKEITATYSATDYLSGHRINVAQVALRGLEVDARKSTAKSAAPAPAAALAPFAGVLNAIRLPGEVRLGRIEADAKILLPDDRTAQLTLDGGGIAPGAPGTIKWKASFADGKKGAALANAQAAGELRVRETSDLRFDAIELIADAAATGPKLPADHLKLEVKLAQPAASAGESIAAEVSLVRGGAAERLLTTRVDYAAGKPVLNGTWQLAVRSEQFAAVLASFGLPEVALTGEGSFTYNVDTSAATASGALSGKISGLEKLGAELAAIGALQVRAAFDGGSSKESAQLGKLEFEVATADGRKLVAVAAQQKLSFSFKDQRLTPERPGAELARVALTGVPLAWAQPVVKPRTIAGGDIAGVLVVEAELDGSRVKARTVEPLMIRGATLREGDKTLVDRVTLSVSPSVDYTTSRIVADAQKISVSTPDGDTLTGAASAEVVTGAKAATSFSAQLQGKVAALVKPYLPADAGPLAVAVNAKGRLEGNALQLSALSIKADRATDSATLVAVEALQPLAIDLNAQKLTAPDTAKPAARVRWGALPLAWAEPYVEKSKLAGQLVPGALEVTFAGADAVAVRALEPIAARGVSVALSGQEWLRGADFATDLNATWKGGALTAEVQKLEVRQGKTPVLTAAFAGDVTPGKNLRANGRGAVSADFVALAQQPALAAQLPLLRGAVNVKFDGAMGDGVTGKATISAQNLVARAGALPLGSMDLSIDAKLDASNSGTVRNALVVTKDGRRSDLLLDGKVGVKPGAISFEGRVTGEQIVVDDMQAFAALGAPAPAAATAKAPAPAPVPRAAPPPATRPSGPVKDTTPVWAGFTGRVDLNLKTIKQGPGTTVKDLRGAITVRDDRLVAENIACELNGNPIKVATILSFDVKQARPYALVGTFEVPRFDVGEFLRRADPAAPPALETTFTMSSKFNGTAANLPEFADRLMGHFELKGSKGILRALNKKAEATSAVTGLLGLAAGLAGQQRLAEGLAGTSQLVGLLKDIPFDGLTVQVDRGADAAIVVKSLELVSPAMHLTGTGRIDHKPGEDFGNNPLSLELQLAAKGDLAQGLNHARQLTGKTDAQGYYLMATPFTLGGTVSKPDSSEFWRNLTLNTGAGFLGR